MAGKTRKSSTKQQARRTDPKRAVVQKGIGVPHEVQDFVDRLQSKGRELSTSSAKAFKNIKLLSSDAVAPAQVTDVIFDIDKSTTAQLVRVYLPGKKPTDPDICNTQSPHGVLHNQVVGTFVTVVIEVAGNPQDVGVVNVTHAEPAVIKLKVADGPVGTKPLYVTG
jgi:hypothetical protein